MSKLRRAPHVPVMPQHNPVGVDHHLQRRLRQETRATPRTDAARASPSLRAPTRCTARDTHGLMASAASVAKIPYRDAADGILADGHYGCRRASGALPKDQVVNLVGILDAFFGATGYHAKRERF